jgi:deoxycytidine triphosphate deaminase
MEALVTTRAEQVDVAPFVVQHITVNMVVVRRHATTPSLTRTAERVELPCAFTGALRGRSTFLPRRMI